MTPARYIGAMASHRRPSIATASAIWPAGHPSSDVGRISSSHLANTVDDGRPTYAGGVGASLAAAAGPTTAAVHEMVTNRGFLTLFAHFVQWRLRNLSLHLQGF
jgi:hypothetical protein